MARPEPRNGNVMFVMRIQRPGGSSLPRTYASATAVIAGVLTLLIENALLSGMALLPSAILTAVLAGLIVVVVATVAATVARHRGDMDMFDAATSRGAVDESRTRTTDGRSGGPPGVPGYNS